jgi:hypothetical protein
MQHGGGWGAEEASKAAMLVALVRVRGGRIAAPRRAPHPGQCASPQAGAARAGLGGRLPPTTRGGRFLPRSTGWSGGGGSATTHRAACGR